MAKILFLPYAYQLGTTFGLIELAFQFKNRGNDVVFAGEGTYINLAKESGFETHKLIEVDFKKYRKTVDSGNINFHNSESLFSHSKKEIQLLKKIKPNLVITQGRTSVIVSCKVLGIPYINLTVAFLTKYYDLPYDIPETFSLYPLVKMPFLGKIINHNAKRFVIMKAKQAARAYNAVLNKYKLPKIESMYDAYEGDPLTLIPESSLIFPINKSAPTEKFQYIGPMINREDLHPVPPWIYNLKKEDGTFIYISMGTSSENLYPNVLTRISKIFESDPAFIIITNSCNLLFEELNLPKNVYITKTAPAKIMMRLADITICHGGKGTLYDSLINRVPILGIPQQAEQEINLNRIKKLGLGDYILPKKFNTMSDIEIRNFILKIIRNDEIKRNLEQYSVQIPNEMRNLTVVVDKIHKTINER